MTVKPKLSDRIKRLGPCREAVKWMDAQPVQQPLRMWKDCKRPEWLLWLIGATDVSTGWSDERKPLVRCAIEIARTAQKWMPAASVAALDTMQKWCDGMVDQSAAYAAAAAHVAYAAADAAAYAAYAATRAATRAADAADAAYAAADAAAYAAYAATRAAACAAPQINKQCCDIIRKHFPRPPRIARAKP